MSSVRSSALEPRLAPFRRGPDSFTPVCRAAQPVLLSQLTLGGIRYPLRQPAAQPSSGRRDLHHLEYWSKLLWDTEMIEPSLYGVSGNYAGKYIGDLECSYPRRQTATPNRCHGERRARASPHGTC